MKETMKFTLRTDRVNKSNKCPLYFRYTYNRKYFNVPTGITLKVTEWDESLESPILKGKDALETLKMMGNIRNQIENKVEVFKRKNSRTPNVDELKELLNESSDLDNNQIVDDLFKLYIDKRKKNISKSTLVVYNSTLKKWKEFEELNGIKVLSQMNIKTLGEFENFLFDMGLQPNTRGKYIKTMKSFLSYISTIEEIQVPESYKRAKVQKEEIDFETLTQDEFEILRHHVFYTKFKSISNLREHVKLSNREILIGKMFLFLCSTGLSYVDFQRVKYTDIVINENKIKSEIGCYIKIDRKKNNTLDECIIPILDNTIDLIIEQLSFQKDFYGDEKPLDFKIKEILKNVLERAEKLNKNNPNFPFLFPKISNHEFNKEIKEVLKKIGFTNNVRIKKRNRLGEVETLVVPKYSIISSHTGRRTYITLCIENGIRPDLIMKSTGQKKFDTLNRYIKRSEMALSREFQQKVVLGDS